MLLSSILTPQRCRWNAEHPPIFTIQLNVLFAITGGIVSANLYYSHPILHVLAQTFDVSQAQIANVPTLAQAGNATGLLLILPLADYFPRRRFVLSLLSVCAVFW